MDSEGNGETASTGETGATDETEAATETDPDEDSSSDAVEASVEDSSEPDTPEPEPTEPTTVGIMALAAAGPWNYGPNVTAELSNGVLTISGNGPMDDYNWDTWAGSGTAPWDGNRADIETIRIESGVTTIGNVAFGGCGNLTSVEISGTVTSIGTGAFRECKKLQSVAIPGSVKTIGSAAFLYTGLTSVDVPEGVTTI